MLKKITAFVQLGVIRSEATALVMRLTELSTHAILETSGREAGSQPMKHGKGQPVRGLGMISIPLISAALNVGRESNVKLAVR